MLLTPVTGCFSSQTSLLSSINLPSELSISLTSNPPSIPSQEGISSVGPGFQQDYMPLFTEQLPPSAAPTPVMSPPAPAPLPPSPSHPLQCQTLGVVPGNPSPAAVAHAGPSSVIPSTAGTQRPTFNLSPRAPRQDHTLPCISLPPQPQSFALPRPIQPTGPVKKSRHVPIVPANPPHLILTGKCFSPHHAQNVQYIHF